MKKLFGILLVAALLLPVLAGCQNSETQQPPVTTLPPLETTLPVKETTAPTEPAVQYITPEEAKSIALKHAGVKESEVRDLEVELDRDDGTLHYDVDFEKDGYDYDYEIDATSGKILKSRKERD